MKIGLLITARLKSTRLPNKLLLDVNGKPLIERVIDRTKEIKGLQKVVLCTSTNPQDKPLTDISLKNNIPYYLGSEEDVLDRLNKAATFFDLDYFLSITGENPFFSIYHANQIVEELKNNSWDFIHAYNLPIGTAVYGLNNKALKVVCKIKEYIDTEIWGPLINRPEIFKIKNLPVDDFYKRPILRLTTDYPEDYKFINEIYSHFKTGETPTLNDVLNVLDRNPKLLRINANREQAGLSESEIKKIDDFYIDNYERIISLKEEIYQD